MISAATCQSQIPGSQEQWCAVVWWSTPPGALSTSVVITDVDREDCVPGADRCIVRWDRTGTGAQQFTIEVTARFPEGATTVATRTLTYRVS